MATKIIHKKSSTSGSSPATSALDQAEIAINLADRKIFTKDNSNAIVNLGGAYVDSTAPATPAEGDLWYDAGNNLLKAHNGSSFVAAGYQNIVDLEDVTIASLADGHILRYDSDTSEFVNEDFDTEVANNSAVTANTSKVSNVTTNLTYTAAETQGTVNSSDGTNAVIPAATTTNAGLMSKADKLLLGSALQGETDTLASVTGRGATTGTTITLTNATTSTTSGTGALKVTGGVGIVENLNVGGNAVVTGNATVTGNLTVSGTTTSVNSTEVNIGDRIILLNSEATGTAASSNDAGIEIERGDDANKSFIWNEGDDAWDLSNETLQNVIIDGGTY